MHITYQFLQAPTYLKIKFVQYMFLKCYLLNSLSVRNIPFAFLVIKRFICKVF